MMGSFNPVRETFVWPTIPPGLGGVTGNWVNTSNIMGPIAVQVVVGPGLAAPVTVTFEATTEDPAAFCQPLAAGATPINKGGFCDPVTALSITINPADSDYVANAAKVCRDFLQCPALFVRAILSVAAPQVSVLIAGKQARTDQV